MNLATFRLTAAKANLHTDSSAEDFIEVVKNNPLEFTDDGANLYTSRRSEPTWFDKAAFTLEEGKEYHALMLDLDVPHAYVPSSTPGHGHLVVDTWLEFDAMIEIMEVLAKHGIIQDGYLEAAKIRGVAAIRQPHIKKTEVEEIGGRAILIERGLPSMHDQIEEVKEFSRNPMPRVSTGIPSLDVMALGPAPGEVFYFIGASGSGKSLVVTNAMYRTIDTPTMFFSIEMPARAVLQRLYGAWADYNVTTLIEDTEHGILPPSFGDMAEVFEKHVVIPDAPISLTDMSKYLQMYDEYMGVRPRAVWVDYLELMSGGSGTEHGGRVEDMARNVKHWAKSEEVAVLMLHQTNQKEKPWDPPQQGSDRYGGFTQGDAVFGIWQPAGNPDLSPLERQPLKDRVLVHVIKNRITGRLSEGRAIVLKKTDSLRLIDLSEQETRRFYGK